MRRINNYEVEHGPFDRPAITYRDRKGLHTVEVETGGLSNVDIEVFHEEEYTYVLSWNSQHPYVGIEKFIGHEPKGNLFLGKHEAIEEVLGERWLELTAMTMVKRLVEYIW